MRYLRYVNFCSDLFGHAGNRLDKNAKVNSKIYDVTNWEANNYYNKHIARYLRL